MLDPVQLGFSVVPEDDSPALGHAAVDWLGWDGGVSGGRPSWLNPECIPCSDAVLRCPECSASRMRFVAQLYCPLGGAEEGSDDGGDDHPCYHRSLYVFACPDCEGPSGCRVLRCQLPRVNPYFPEDPPEENVARADLEKSWVKHRPETYGCVCEICNFPSRIKCPVTSKNFCGEGCSAEYKKFVYEPWVKDGKVSTLDEYTENAIAGRRLPSVYDRMEIVVEEEPEEEIGNVDDDAKVQRAADGALFPDDADDEDGDDANMEQTDLNRIVASAANGGTGKRVEAEDPVSTAFRDRLGRGGQAQGQVLRYSRWPDNVSAVSDDEDDDDNDDDGDDDEVTGGNGVLWVRSHPVPASVPPCARCGAPRKFEFQIMPQMLHALGAGKRAAAGTALALVDAARAADAILQKVRPDDPAAGAAGALAEDTAGRAAKALLRGDGDAMDWGTVAVYTCTKSCTGREGLALRNVGMGAYVEEFGWKQPPI